MKPTVPAQVVNILISTAVELLDRVAGLPAELAVVRVAGRLPASPAMAVSMIILPAGIGPVTWVFEPKVAQTVAARLLDQKSLPPFTSEECADAVGELANLIAGNATAALEGAGFSVEMSPPATFVELNVPPSMLSQRCLDLEMSTAVGHVNLLISTDQVEPPNGPH
jgi:CheY-specific phosphatase CheX